MIRVLMLRDPRRGSVGADPWADGSTGLSFEGGWREAICEFWTYLRELDEDDW